MLNLENYNEGKGNVLLLWQNYHCSWLLSTKPGEEQ